MTAEELKGAAKKVVPNPDPESRQGSFLLVPPVMVMRGRYAVHADIVFEKEDCAHIQEFGGCLNLSDLELVQKLREGSTLAK